MAGYLNKVQLIGNLGREPDIRHTQDGNKVVTFPLATSEFWRDKTTNERRDRTEWHRVVIFNDRLCEVAEKYIHKGSKIYLEGQLQTRKWTDNSGQEKYTTEVIIPRFRGDFIMLDAKGGSDNLKPLGEDKADTDVALPEDTADSSSNTATPTKDSLDDEIPF